MNKIYYTYYILFNYMMLFLIYIISTMVVDNVFLQLLALIITVLYIFNEENIIKNFYTYEHIGKKDLFQNEIQKNYEIALNLKKALIVLFACYLFYLELSSILLILITIDIFSSLTLEDSLLEYYLNRKIIFVNQKRGGINEN